MIAAPLPGIFQSADHVIANIEGAVYDGASEAGAFVHTTKPEAVMALDAICADVWNLSNNHIMDAGAEGVIRTLRIAVAHRRRTIGAGGNLAEASAPVIFPEDGGTGIFGVG